MDKISTPPQAGIAAQLDAVNTFLRSQNPMMLIVGEAGSGKTTLLNELVSKSRAAFHVIRLRGSKKLTPTQLTQALCTHWAITIQDTHARLESQLHEVLLALAEHDQNCLLIVDDAHNLSYALLAALAHLAIQQENMKVHLHILLSGRPTLSHKVSSLQTRTIPEIIIGALSLEDAMCRMKQWLQKAHISEENIEPSVLTQIYQAAAGMPEALHQRTLAYIEAHQENHAAQPRSLPPALQAALAQTRQHLSPTRLLAFVLLLGSLMIWHQHRLMPPSQARHQLTHRRLHQSAPQKNHAIALAVRQPIPLKR